MLLSQNLKILIFILKMFSLKSGVNVTMVNPANMMKQSRDN